MKLSLTVLVVSLSGCAGQGDFKKKDDKPHWILGDPSRPTHIGHKARQYNGYFFGGGGNPARPIPASSMPVTTVPRKEVHIRGNGYSYDYSQGQANNVWSTVDIYGRATVECSTHTWKTEYRSTWPKRPDPVGIELVPTR